MNQGVDTEDFELAEWVILMYDGIPKKTKKNPAYKRA